MGLFRSNKADPISERTRVLTEEIAALEAQIRDLGDQLQSDPVRAPARATNPSAPRPGASAPPPAPVFEPVRHRQLPPVAEGSADTHYNDLGVRKYDLAGAWHRLQQHFRGPAASNPRLINYLAAGSIQGLRPLRYERRVARNRVLALSLLLFFVLWGLIAVLRR